MNQCKKYCEVHEDAIKLLGYWQERAAKHKAELAELRKFVMDVTLFLQKHAHHDMKKIEPMFQRAYRLYVKYDVENYGKG